MGNRRAQVFKISGGTLSRRKHAAYIKISVFVQFETA